MANLSLPAIPQTADINAMYIYLKSLHYFLQNIVLNGIQLTEFSQDQINQMNQLTQTGKIFYNTSTNKPYVAIDNAGVLEIKEVSLI
jgi:hypothetical protein